MVSRMIAFVFLTLTISGCSTLSQLFSDPPEPRQVQIITKPVQIDIVQPVLPRAIDLKEPKFYVVSDSKIVEPCLKNEEGVTDCKLGRETQFPEGYTYFDRFLDDIKKKHGGDVVFVGLSIADYELMAYNTQELKRYINQLGEVIVYYKTVTTKPPEPEGDPPNEL